MRKADLLLEVSPSSDWCLLPTRLLWWLGRLEGLHQKSWYDKQTSKVSASRFAHASMCMCACLSASVKWCFIQSQSFESPLESQAMHLLVERSKEVKKYDKTSIEFTTETCLAFWTPCLAKKSVLRCTSPSTASKSSMSGAAGTWGQMYR